MGTGARDAGIAKGFCGSLQDAAGAEGRGHSCGSGRRELQAEVVKNEVRSTEAARLKRKQCGSTSVAVSENSVEGRKSPPIQCGETLFLGPGA